MAESDFFRSHQDSFVKYVDLSSLVAALWQRGRVLTEEEFQQAKLGTVTEYTRKQNLAYALSRKPSEVAWIVLGCLEESSNSNISHKYLAAELRHYLQHQQPDQFRQDAVLQVSAVADEVFASAIHRAAEALQQHGISIGDIIAALNSICSRDGIPLSPLASTAVPDFPSLVALLYQQGFCNEFDIDLLCKVLEDCGALEPQRVFHEYSNSLMGVNVLSRAFSRGNVPSHEHFFALTFHSVPNLSLELALGVKDFLAAYLQIPRHTFSLKRANTGSVILVWQFPSLEFKRIKSMLEDMHSEQRIKFSEWKIMKVKLRPPLGTEVGDEVEIPIRRRKSSNEISSTTDEEEELITTAVKVKRARSILSHPEECQGE